MLYIYSWMDIDENQILSRENLILAGLRVQGFLQRKSPVKKRHKAESLHINKNR
jgi:hypothetical protein